MSDEEMTSEQVLTSARSRLAHHLAFPGLEPLSDADCELLIECGLCQQDDFSPAEAPATGDEEESWWNCDPRKWGVTYRDGRPRLVPASTRPHGPLTELEQVERDFATMVYVVSNLFGDDVTDDMIAELRQEPPWSELLRDARTGGRDRSDEFRHADDG